MSIEKKREDTLENIEGVLTEYSSFEELFDEIDEEELFKLIENDDSYEELMSYRENDEYDYFINEYIQTLESFLNNANEDNIFNVLYVFHDLDKDEIERFFNWN